MPFDVVKGVTLPTWQRERKYNIDELEIDDSLVIPKEEPHTASAIYTSARQYGISVSIRVMPSDDDRDPPRWKEGDTIVKRVATRAPRKARAAE